MHTVASACSSAGLGAESRPCQGDIQLWVVLGKRGTAVMEDQLSQRAVQVEGLRETIARRRLVDHTVFGGSVHAV